MLTADPTMPSVISSEIGSSAGPGFCAQLPRLSACCNWKHFSRPLFIFGNNAPFAEHIAPRLWKLEHTLLHVVLVYSRWPCDHLRVFFLGPMCLCSLFMRLTFTASVGQGAACFLYCVIPMSPLLATKQQSIGNWSVFPCHGEVRSMGWEKRGEGIPRCRQPNWKGWTVEGAKR